MNQLIGVKFLLDGGSFLSVCMTANDYAGIVAKWSSGEKGVFSGVCQGQNIMWSVSASKIVAAHSFDWAAMVQQMTATQGLQQKPVTYPPYNVRGNSGVN